MLTSLTFTILQSGMCNFEFYCHYPAGYLRYTDKNKKNMCSPCLVLLWTFTLTVSKEMKSLPRFPRILIGNWAAACYSCGWFYPTTESSSGGWIQVAVDSILRLTPVSAAEYEFRMILSCGWLEYRWLDANCGWFYPAADSSFGCWIRVAADSILRLTRILMVGCKLRLILWHRWLEFQRLDTSCGWFHATAVSSSGS